MNRAQLARLAPQFDWTATLKHIGLGAMPTVVVGEPSAVAAAGNRIADVPLSTWKDWMTFQFISAHSQFLSKAFDDAHFGFYGKTLQGDPYPFSFFHDYVDGVQVSFYGTGVFERVPLPDGSPTSPYTPSITVRLIP